MRNATSMALGLHWRYIRAAGSSFLFLLEPVAFPVFGRAPPTWHRSPRRPRSGGLSSETSDTDDAKVSKKDKRKEKRKRSASSSRSASQSSGSGGASRKSASPPTKKGKKESKKDKKDRDKPAKKPFCKFIIDCCISSSLAVCCLLRAMPWILFCSMFLCQFRGPF